MSQRTDRVDELLRQEIGQILAQDVAGPAHRVRHGHRRRDDAGPAPRAGLGERHRRPRRARRRRSPRSSGRCGSSATSWACGCGSSGSRSSTSRSTTRRSAGRACCGSSTSSEPGRCGRRGARRRAARRVAADAGAARSAARAMHREPEPTVAARARRRRRRAPPRAADGRRRIAGATAPGGRTADAAPATGREPMTAIADLAALAAAVPERSSSGCAAAPDVLAVGHENPDADALGAALAIGLHRRGARRAGRPSPSSDGVPPLYRFLPGVDARPDRPGAGRRPTTWSSCATAATLARGAIRERNAGPVRRHAARRRSTTTPATTAPATWPGSTRTRRRPARWSRSSPTRLGVPLDAGRRRAGRGSDGRDRHGHRDLRPPERHAADPARRGGARRGRGAAVRHLPAAVPDEARRPAAPLRARARPARAARRRARGRLGDGARRPRRDRRPLRALGGDHRPAGPGRDGRGGDPAQGEGRGDPRVACGRSPAASTPRSCAGRAAAAATPRGRRRVAAAAAATPRRRRPGGRAGWPSRARREPSVRAEPGRAGRAARRDPRRRQAGRARPRTTSWRWCGASPGRGKIGHGGTLDPFASGVLPLFLGLGTRVVEYHLGARKAYRATVVFGAGSTTDDLEGELTPARGRRPDARRRGDRPGRLPWARSSSARRPSRPARSAGGGPTPWPAAARLPSCKPRDGDVPRAGPRGVGRRAIRSTRSRWSTWHARRGRMSGRSPATSGAAVGSAAYLGRAPTHGVRPVRPRRRPSARRGPGRGRRTGRFADPLLPVGSGLDALPALALTDGEVRAVAHGGWIGRLERLGAAGRGGWRPARRSASSRRPGRSPRSRASRPDGRLVPDKVLVDREPSARAEQPSAGADEPRAGADGSMMAGDA